jgi:hypothetical protein
MKIDLQKWREDHARFLEQARDLKARRTESKQPRWTPKDEGDLCQVKAHLTVLYGVRARARGRDHLTKFPARGLSSREAFLAHVDNVIAFAYVKEDRAEAAE